MVGTMLFSILMLTTPGGHLHLGPQSSGEPLPIASLLKSREPGWQFENLQAAGKSSIYEFSRGGQQLVVTVTQADTEEAAEERFDFSSKVITAAPHEINGVGDRCMVWVDPPSGITTLLFRRHKMVLQLVAPSRDEAIKLARQIDESLAP